MARVYSFGGYVPLQGEQGDAYFLGSIAGLVRLTRVSEAFPLF
jgi:hypothetical protein